MQTRRVSGISLFSLFLLTLLTASHARADYDVTGLVEIVVKHILDEEGEPTGEYSVVSYTATDLEVTVPITWDIGIRPDRLGTPGLHWNDVSNWDNPVLPLANSVIVTASLAGAAAGDVSLSTFLDPVSVLTSGGPTERTISVGIGITSDDIPGWELNLSAGATIKYNVTLASGADVIMNQTAVLENLTIRSGAGLSGNSGMVIRNDLNCGGRFLQASGTVSGSFNIYGNAAAGDYCSLDGYLSLGEGMDISPGAELTGDGTVEGIVVNDGLIEPIDRLTLRSLGLSGSGQAVVRARKATLDLELPANVDGGFDLQQPVILDGEVRLIMPSKLNWLDTSGDGIVRVVSNGEITGVLGVDGIVEIADNAACFMSGENKGLIRVINGGTFRQRAADFTNRGQMKAIGGAEIIAGISGIISHSLVNNGEITMDDSTISFLSPGLTGDGSLHLTNGSTASNPRVSSDKHTVTVDESSRITGDGIVEGVVINDGLIEPVGRLTLRSLGLSGSGQAVVRARKATLDLELPANVDGGFDLQQPVILDGEVRLIMPSKLNWLDTSGDGIVRVVSNGEITGVLGVDGIVEIADNAACFMSGENKGLIRVINGGTFRQRAADFTNRGQMKAIGGAEIIAGISGIISHSLVNNGEITMDDSTISFLSPGLTGDGSLHLTNGSTASNPRVSSDKHTVTVDESSRITGDGIVEGVVINDGLIEPVGRLTLRSLGLSGSGQTILRAGNATLDLELPANVDGGFDLQQPVILDGEVQLIMPSKSDWLDTSGDGIVRVVSNGEITGNLGAGGVVEIADNATCFMSGENRGLIHVINGGTFRQRAADFTNRGQMKAIGGAEIIAGISGIISHSLVNNGEITMDDSTISFLSPGLTGDGSLHLTNGSTAMNPRVSSDTHTVTVNESSRITGSGPLMGTIILRGGTIDMPSLSLANGTHLLGSGLVAGNLRNSGVVSPGESLGHIQIEGDYTADSASTTTLELSGNPSHTLDQITVSGTATFEGNLEVLLVHDFNAEPGKQYSAISYSSHFGTFSDITGLSFPGGELVPEYSANALHFTVAGPPLIATQPQPTSIEQGQTGELSIAATGVGELLWQWEYFDSSLQEWADMDGATDKVLTIGPMTTIGEYQYRCAVTNSYGTTVSDLATVTVEEKSNTAGGIWMIF